MFWDRILITRRTRRRGLRAFTIISQLLGVRIGTDLMRSDALLLYLPEYDSPICSPPIRIVSEHASVSR